MIYVFLRVQNALVRRGLRAVLAMCDDVSVRDGESFRPAVAGPVGTRAGSIVTVIDESSLTSLSDRESYVMVISDSPGDALLNAIKQGVRGIVAESMVEEDLVRAVRATALDNAFVSDVTARYLLDSLAVRLPDHTSEVRKALDRLSHRERQVLRLLGKAQANADIAAALRISEATVRSHIYHILTKLDLETRTEAVLFGHQFTLATAGEPSLT